MGPSQCDTSYLRAKSSAPSKTPMQHEVISIRIPPKSTNSDPLSSLFRRWLSSSIHSFFPKTGLHLSLLHEGSSRHQTIQAWPSSTTRVLASCDCASELPVFSDPGRYSGRYPIHLQPRPRPRRRRNRHALPSLSVTIEAPAAFCLRFAIIQLGRPVFNLTRTVIRGYFFATLHNIHLDLQEGIDWTLPTFALIHQPPQPPISYQTKHDLVSGLSHRGLIQPSSFLISSQRKEKKTKSASLTKFPTSSQRNSSPFWRLLRATRSPFLF